MKIILDEKVCLKHNLTLQEALIATAAYLKNYNPTFHNMINREIIDTNYELSPQWKTIISKLVDSDDEEHLLALAKQMRELFPEGKQLGTAFYYRCNTREIALRLKKFFETYGEYSDELLLKATKKFVASYKGDYKFLPLIKYFISKNKKVLDEDGTYHIREVSELASTLENMNDEEDDNLVEYNEDWTSKLV